MTEEQARRFFNDWRGRGETKPVKMKKMGSGWAVSLNMALSSWDWAGLTKLIVMAHDEAVRVEIKPCRWDLITVAIFPRPRGWGQNDHPELEGHVARIRRDRQDWATRFPLTITDGEDKDPGRPGDDHPGDGPVIANL